MNREPTSARTIYRHFSLWTACVTASGVKRIALRFDNGRGQELAARLERPYDEPRGYALFAHCFTCSKDVAAATRISRALVGEGLGVLRFDFTGLGNSEGDFANENFSSNVEDLVAAAGIMRREYGAPSLLVGHSLGGAAVLAAAEQIPEVTAVSTIGAPADPAHVTHLIQDDLETIRQQGHAQVRLAGRDFTITRQFLEDLETQATQQRLRRLGRALLVFHAPADELVPIDEARKIFEAARHPKSFVSLDSADHLLTNRADSRYVAVTLTAWASRYIPAPPTEVGPEGVVEISTLGGKFAQTVVAGRHRMVGDEPRSVGGEDLGPGPYDYLLAALGTCTSMTLQMYARRKQWPLESVHIRLSHARMHAQDCEECEQEDGFVDRIAKQIEIEGPLDASQRKRLLEMADRCPVHRTLQNRPTIVTKPSP